MIELISDLVPFERISREQYDYFLNEMFKQRNNIVKIITDGSIGCFEDYTFQLGRLRSLDECIKLFKIPKRVYSNEN